jgi:purine nucleoside phosphorylase
VGLDDLQTSYFVHPDNAAHARRSLDVSVAIVARPDDHMVATDTVQIIVETESGVHTRCYLSSHAGIPFLIVYGRFDRVRSPSREIDFALTQRALSMLGIRTLVGTFVVGAVHAEDRAGTVVVPDNFIGFGGWSDESWKTRPEGFRNVEMFSPFCPGAREALAGSALRLHDPVYTDGSYICFHGWPRIETSAELAYYAQLGGRVVGQTLDPEATLARQAGLHYAAITAMMDDEEVRALFRTDHAEGAAALGANIRAGRKKTFATFLESLPQLAALNFAPCGCDQHVVSKRKRSGHFYYRPEHLIAD